MNKLAISLLITVAVLNLAMAKVALKDPKEDVLEFIKGFFKGFSNEDVKDLGSCHIEDMGMLKTFEKAKISFDKHDGIGSVVDGLKLMGQFIGEAVLQLGACPGVRDTVTRIGARIAEIVDPINFLRIAGKNVVLHGWSVIDAVNKALAAKDRGNHFEFGEHIGEAIQNLFS
eukprot:403354673